MGKVGSISADWCFNQKLQERRSHEIVLEKIKGIADEYNNKDK